MELIQFLYCISGHEIGKKNWSAIRIFLAIQKYFGVPYFTLLFGNPPIFWHATISHPVHVIVCFCSPFHLLTLVVHKTQIQKVLKYMRMSN